VSSLTLEVRGGVVLANQSGSVVSSQGPRHPTVLIPRGSLNRYHHESPRKLLLRPSSTHGNPARQTSSSPTESRHCRAHLIADSVHRGNSISAHSLLYNQGYPKVCPDSLNLLNAGDSFAGISSLTFCYLFSRTRDLIASF
jgi:hypothetical protein